MGLVSDLKRKRRRKSVFCEAEVYEEQGLFFSFLAANERE
jgi:hypothetical protein